MNAKFGFYYILILIFFTSCYTSASYALYNGPVDNKVHIYKDRKYVLVNNNVLIDDDEFNNSIKKDFSSLIGDNLLVKPTNFFLEFENKKLVTKLLLDETMLNGIKSTSGADYLIFIRTFGKTNNGTSIKKDALFSTEDASKFDGYREYHIILQLYDLNTHKLLYAKESISLYKRITYSGMSPSQVSQLNQTYNRLFKDFKKSLK
ncbi:hypothetical protein [Elizabethkingia anophelis]|uniref:hypothetical protein n=1 Tax=Elizabethkingia anophelis TaxID=1117645 RepID=UPI001C8819D7|nr:hypothetical protein [Elizabethkingia anophelis]MCL1689408.1 hypothetical protein [Elizabethkingia anophelis]